jgi:Bacteriophage KPP10, Structural protein ORF10
MSTVYSFKDTSGNMSDPDVGSFQFAGNIGMGQFTVEMATEKSDHNVASDGSVMVSAIAGDNGHVMIEVQQTSQLHTFLVKWYNAKNTGMKNGNVTNFASAALTLRNIIDGSTHVCKGITPQRMPPKVYARQGQMLTWTLMCADIQTVTLGASLLPI